MAPDSTKVQNHTDPLSEDEALGMGRMPSLP